MNIRKFLERRGEEAATVRPSDSAHDAAVFLAERKVGAAVVSGDDGQVIGIISERDIVRAYAAHESSLAEQTVESLMTSDVVTCSPETDIGDVVRLMDAHHIRHVPIVDGTSLVGIVSIRDIVTRRLVALETDVEVLRNQLLEQPSAPH